MKHLLFADKTILVGDAAADALVDYSVALAANGTADKVVFTGIGADGATVRASFVLNSGTALVAETTPSDLPEPDNEAEVARILARTRALTSSNAVQAVDQDDSAIDFDFESRFLD